MLEQFSKTILVAGTDEAGRGCLAGPVTAAAVILPFDFYNELLNDSKQLSERKRMLLMPLIKDQAISYGICHISHQEIDQINILNASILGMHRSLDAMNMDPEMIIVDGNKFKPYKELPHQCVVKGDGKYLSIAAASVLAKTARDHYMEELDAQYPMYNWRQNKGYPTKEHREAIKKYGLSPYHRTSFKQLPTQISLEF
ncbi:MAG: ribonuclease HII [Flavobacteriaceae bacterium]|jgi:ribonuclease HII|nr:ribonuclease HII [Flavobacteriaceae bacterium]NVJ72967.1 ribonuclease HII [Flavobacteriaceae bacterium]